MNITQVKIKRLDGNAVKAMATVTVNDELVLTGLKVIESQNGTFVSMPSLKGKEGETDKRTGKQKYYDIFYPITAEARQQIIDSVMAEYGKDEVVKTTPEAVDGFVDVDDSDLLPF